MADPVAAVGQVLGLAHDRILCEQRQEHVEVGVCVGPTRGQVLTFDIEKAPEDLDARGLTQPSRCAGDADELIEQHRRSVREFVVGRKDSQLVDELGDERHVDRFGQGAHPQGADDLREHLHRASAGRDAATGDKAGEFACPFLMEMSIASFVAELTA